MASGSLKADELSQSQPGSIVKSCLSDHPAKVSPEDLRPCSYSHAPALSEGGDDSPKCAQAVVIPRDRHRPKAAKLSPRSESSRLLLLAQRKENNGVRELTERVDSVSSKRTKNEKSRKRKRQDATMKIQQSDETPNGENETTCKSKYRCRLSLLRHEPVTVETSWISQVRIVHPSKNDFYSYTRYPHSIPIIARVLSQLEMIPLSPHQIPAPWFSETEEIITYH